MSPTAAERTVRWTIESELAQVRPLARQIEALAPETPFSAEVWHQVQVCIVEAVNNAILHAYGKAKGQPIEVSITLGPEEVVCRVVDRGRPMARRGETPRLEFCRNAPETLPEGGMGLFIMHQVMDRVEYDSENGRNELRLTKYAPES